MKFVKKFLLFFLGTVLFIIFLPVILLVLFAPFKYAVVARTGKSLTVRAKASYLFRLITVRYLRQKERIASEVRIAGFRVGGSHKAMKNNEIKKREEKNEEEKNNNVIPENIQETEQDTEIDEDDSPKMNLRAILTYPELKIIMGLVLKWLKKTVRVILPRRLDISGTVGFDDPAATGLFTGAYESLAAALNLRRRVRLVPDFAEPGVTLKISVSGKISLARLMRPALALLLKKPIRKFIRFLRKGGDRREIK